MSRLALLLLALTAAAAMAQGASKPSTARSAAPGAAPKAAQSTSTVSAEPWVRLPPGIPRVVHGPVKVAPIAVRYEDIKVGTGAVGEPGKLWHLNYTGWRAADGVKFDSSVDRRPPVIGKDGKPVLGPDGKPRFGDPQPMAFPQGIGAVIPGFDFGLAGMRVGGKRRIFIPWQLAYGSRDLPARPSRFPGAPDFPGIPSKSDLIFDVELVDITAMPTPQQLPAPAPHAATPQHPGTSAQPATTAPAIAQPKAN